MAQVIKHRALSEDAWLQSEAEPGATLPAHGNVIVPLARWLRERDALLTRRGETGVCLETDANPETLAADLSRLKLVAIRFASFTDGRGYTLARLLRDRYGYRGELRAIGDVLRDQLYYLWRCGFDAFVLRPGQDAEQALAAFDDFSESYQSSVERPAPLFRRRAGASSTPIAVATDA
jgi:uncharacterized protein (DUF934 family)